MLILGIEERRNYQRVLDAAFDTMSLEAADVQISVVDLARNVDSFISNLGKRRQLDNMKDPCFVRFTLEIDIKDKLNLEMGGNIG